MDSIKKLKGTTVFASIHELNIAAQYCERLIAMKDGEIIAVGAVEEVRLPILVLSNRSSFN